jgi:hypothetical protein
LKESRLKGTKENGTGMGNELDLHEINWEFSKNVLHVMQDSNMKAGEPWFAASTQHIIKILCCFQHLDHGRQTMTPSVNNQQQPLATSSPHNNDVSMTHSPAAPNNHTPPGSVGQSHVSPVGQLVSTSISAIRNKLSFYMVFAQSELPSMCFFSETNERISIKFDTWGPH